jgi:hypothetical protein
MTVHTRKESDTTIIGGHKRSGIQLAAERQKIAAFQRKEAFIRKRRAELIARASTNKSDKS